MLSTTSQNVYRHLQQREYGHDKINCAKVSEEITVHNLRNNNYETLVLKKWKPIDIKTHGQFAATLHQDNSIRLLDLETYKYKWTYKPDEDVFSNEKVVSRHIVGIFDNLIVCAEIFRNTVSGNNLRLQYSGSEILRIKTLDFNTGKKITTISHPLMSYDVDRFRTLGKLCVIGKQIFCLLNNHNLAVWNLEGKLVRTIEERYLNHCKSKTTILGNDKFLVCIFGGTIIVIDLLQERPASTYIYKYSISSAFLDDSNNLIYVYEENDDRSCKTFCKVMKLDNCVPTNSAQINQNIEDFDPNSYIASGPKVCGNAKVVYLGLTNGKICMYNFAEKKCIELGKHKKPITNLSIININDEQFLMSASNSIINIPGEVKIWDIQANNEIKSVCEETENEKPKYELLKFKSNGFCAHAFAKDQLLISGKDTLDIHNFLVGPNKKRKIDSI